MKKLITLIFIIVFLSSPTFAQELSNIKENIMDSTTLKPANMILATNLQKLLHQDEMNFNLVLKKQGSHNQQPITLKRFEPEQTTHLGHQHISFVIDKNSDMLLGFVRLLPKYIRSEQQVSKVVAFEITLNFLKNYAPDLLVNYKNSWIDTHDETIMVADKKITITGIKVKCRDLNTGLYFWTIIALDQSVMVFERNIEWDFIRAGRQTQKWLHDQWLNKNL